jgi:hypothetical protein
MNLCHKTNTGEDLWLAVLLFHGYSVYKIFSVCVVGHEVVEVFTLNFSI